MGKITKIMKKLIVSAAFMLLASGLIAQSGDTLKIPLGKYDFISIGTKVYEIDVNLKEVPVLKLWTGSQFWGDHIMPAVTYPRTLPEGTIDPAIGWRIGGGITIDSQPLISSSDTSSIFIRKPKTKHKK